jgi:hypothetical protein
MMTSTDALIAIFTVIILLGLGLLRLGRQWAEHERFGAPLKTEWPEQR